MPEVLKPSYESDTGEYETESPPLDLKRRNAIQMALMEDSGLEGQEWLDRYGKRVRDLIDNDPDLRNLIREDQELAKIKIKALMEEGPKGMEEAA